MMPSRRQVLASTGALAGALAGYSALGLSTDPPNQVWSTDLGDYRDTFDLHAVDSNRLYAFLRKNGSESHLIAVDAEHGESLWTGTTPNGYALVADSNGAYTSADATSTRGVQIDAFDPAGEHQWTTPLAEGTTLALGPELVYAGNSGQLFALDRETGAERWQTSTQKEGAPFSVAAGTLYVNESSLTARATDDGSVQWEGTPESDLWYEPIVANGMVYASDFHDVYALDATDGTQHWHTSFQPGSVKDIVGLRDGSLYVAVSTSPSGPEVPSFTTVYRLNAADGSMREVYQVDETRATQLALTDTALVVVTRDSQIIVVNAVDLSERWRASAAEGEFIRIATLGETIYTLDAEAPLRAFRE